MMSEEQQAEKTSAAAPEGYKRILIVDDEEQVIFVLRNSLKKLGPMYEIVTAHNGQEALSKFEQAPADLVITDLSMPEMDGVTLTEAVRTRAPQAKVVWVTAFEQWQDEAERLGVRRYILKPLDVDKIRQIAREELQGPADACSVLVMDDNDDLRRLYTKALKKAGYQAFPAATIQEARALLAQNRFDVFLCDIRMGGEGLGTDLLREQIDSLNAQGTHVIMISAEARYRDMCEEMGVEFYVEKPVAIPPLITLINRLTSACR